MSDSIQSTLGITPALLSPYNLGKFTLAHRVVMAPMMRCRAIDGVPSQSMVEYYTQRSTKGGLLIAEGTIISPTGSRLLHCAGIYTKEQVQAWKKVVDAVHGEGAIIFCQLVHVGRASHNAFQPGGAAPISSTNKPVSSKKRIILPDGSEAQYSLPQALNTSEVRNVVNCYHQAALNAIESGFDGVEIHAGHGYLIDQFLKDSINDRTDEYGGSLANRCRFLVEIVNSVAQAVGTDRIGIKISPVIDHLEAVDSDAFALGLAVVESLNNVQTSLGSKLAYLHLTHPRFTAREASGFEPRVRVQSTAEDTDEELVRMLRRAYEGSFMCSGGYTRESGVKAVERGEADLIAYGRLFISNPDLVHRLMVNGPFNKYVGATFYTNDPVVGYIDYPILNSNYASKKPNARL